MDPDRHDLHARTRNCDVAELSDRTVVILSPNFIDEWLDTATVGDQALVDASAAPRTSRIPRRRKDHRQRTDLTPSYECEKAEVSRNPP